MANPLYQNFILSLINVNIAKIKEIKVEKYFSSLFLLLKEKNYITDNNIIKDKT